MGEMRTKIIFLDFDGVLVNRKSYFLGSGDRTPADSDCVEVLNKIVELSNAAIVISSAWRIGRSLAELKDILLSWNVKAKVLDKTPNGTMIRGIHVGLPRGKEIDSWLRNNDRYQVESFVILDDDIDMQPHIRKLVRTEFDVGLTRAHIFPAMQILEHS
jgi:hypothetical protein